MMVLGGDVEMAYHAGLLAASYALWLWWTRRDLRQTPAGEGSAWLGWSHRGLAFW